MQLERLAEGFTSELFHYEVGRVLKLFRPAFADPQADVAKTFLLLEHAPVGVCLGRGLMRCNRIAETYLQAYGGHCGIDLVELQRVGRYWGGGTRVAASAVRQRPAG